MDIHFNSYKVKYTLLNSFFRPIRTSHVIKTVNIFINIDDLFHMLHKPLINNEFQVCGVNAGKQLISNIFNLIGHYRNWGLKERLDITVYGIYTSNIRSFKNSIHVINYRKKFRENNEQMNTAYFFINEAIRSALPIIPIISNYIPDIYMIDSKYLEPSIIPLYIANEVNKADWNILISRDTYDLQYAYKDKWSYISPKGDNSRLITRKNMWNYLNEKERIYKDPVDLTYDYDLYILAKSLVGDKYRNIPRLRKIGWKTLFKYLDDVKINKADSGKVTMQLYLLELLKNKKITNEEMNNNIDCTDVEKQVNVMMDIDKTSILYQLIDIEDYENLKVLNNTQFSKYPLNLNFLCNRIVQKSPFD